MIWLNLSVETKYSIVGYDAFGVEDLLTSQLVKMIQGFGENYIT